MRYNLIAAAILLLSTSAIAQTRSAIIASIGSDGELQGNWAAIEKCARTPYPKAADVRHQQPAEHYFHTINSCRLMLSARHAGWIAAGGKPEDNPYKPAPSFREDDFKTELVCDFDKLKNGVGVLPCNVDLAR